MPGQFEGIKNLLERMRSITDAMTRTADPKERERLTEKMRVAHEDLAEWRAATQRDADSGDSEALDLLGEFQELREEED